MDIGSTTTKAVVIDPVTLEVLYERYKRHNARQGESVLEVVSEIADRFPDTAVRMAICGSGGHGVAETLSVPFVQEVVANSIAVRALYPKTRTAIELGGQDAKMIFFHKDDETGELEVSDMRMNGSCAGGTGAFVDEIASVLDVPAEGFEQLASRGRTVHEISGRCGVYAKTDIQPLLNQGVPREDIALSACHAIAKQTIGGLSQGIDINPPVIFEGGPLTFNPTLVRAFAERLGLGEQDIVRPEHPEVIVAYGTALALEGMFADREATVDPKRAAELVRRASADAAAAATSGEPFFASRDEYDAFMLRHRPGAPVLGPEGARSLAERAGAPADESDRLPLDVYLGIDSGSTTTKLAFITQDGELVDSAYANNGGDPLAVARDALVEIRNRHRAAGVELRVRSCGTTGYGELMFARALHADCHTVETVAHACAARTAVPDATFVLDIGGQDMKGIWLQDGVVTDIEVNEACSSGCGSFLENFATSLGIPVEKIAESAFRAKHPAVLGSRCTVFMNSSVVTEQRNGKTPDDIMAGLARSIVENVFTKVIRLSNTSSLGDRIVVQGGTFRNDAVLRALEQYLGREVVRAPYPGLMGAIGIATIARDRSEGASSFIGLDALDGFSYAQRTGVVCPFCNNHCSRTLVTFSDGTTWVTGNRCPRGEVVGDPGDAEVRERLRAASKGAPKAADLFELRRKLLFKDYPVAPVADAAGVRVGVPRVLANWDAMPFWSTFMRALGVEVVLSPQSTRAMYEEGLPAVTSDTVCFPAKLVHGHLRALARMGVDRIFMPVVTTVPSENVQETSESMCAVLKGYPLVVRNSDNPETRWGIPFDAPLFHWYSDRDRAQQLEGYFGGTFGFSREQISSALEQADAAQAAFKSELVAAGERILADAARRGAYAVVLASRPYHNDPLVNHGLPSMFAEIGVPVLPPDAVPGIDEVDLSNSRLDIVNNFHARMLGAAVVAASSPALEYVQVVSFGCGHDAYLSDEIRRLMATASDKVPLILKVDESDVAGPLRIRVRSFAETVGMRRRAHADEIERAGRRAAAETDAALAEAALERAESAAEALPDPYPVKYTAGDRAERVVLVPNTSHAFSMLMAAAFSKQGVRAVPLPVGHERAAELGKRYVHNDICFPAQMTVGETLAALEDGGYDHGRVAVATGKYIGDCRLTHYAALLRKALDDAGYADVPIVTNDDVDAHDMHPGFKMSLATSLRIAMGLPMIDAMEELLRKIRPYERVKGAAEAAFDKGLSLMADGLAERGARGLARGFRRAVDLMREVAYDRAHLRPRVLIVGEYLLNFHPGANRDVERYLERNGFEVVEARMTDVIRKTYFYKHAQVRAYHVDKPPLERAWYALADTAFEAAHALTDRIACAHPLYERATRLPELARESDPVIDRTFDAGEGILIPGEIIHHAKRGVRSFLILQPFGCLPNHVVGRGLVKKLKELYPRANILSLDYDPDMSFANIENRLQMLVMNAMGGDGHGQTA